MKFRLVGVVGIVFQKVHTTARGTIQRTKNDLISLKQEVSVLLFIIIIQWRP
jgi:hypothetical protein